MENASEQSTTKSEAEVMPVEEFSKLSLKDMETKMSTPVKVEAKDQSKQNSEVSDEVSENDNDSSSEDKNEAVVTQDTEETSDDETTEAIAEDDSESSTSDDTEDGKDNQDEVSKGNADSLKKELEKVNKNYKALQAEFTKRNQAAKDKDVVLNKMQERLEALEGKNVTDNSPANKKLAQLKEKSPETADFINDLVTELVEEKVGKKLKPVEEQALINTRKGNIDAFNKATDDFRKSELAPLEADIVAIINEDESWQERIMSNPNAFKELEKELVYRHKDKVAKLLTKGKKVVKIQNKHKQIEIADVGKKPNKSGEKSTDELSEDEFKGLSLADMEKRLPKHRG